MLNSSRQMLRKSFQIFNTVHLVVAQVGDSGSNIKTRFNDLVGEEGWGWVSSDGATVGVVEVGLAEMND